MVRRRLFEGSVVFGEGGGSEEGGIGGSFGGWFEGFWGGRSTGVWVQYTSGFYTQGNRQSLVQRKGKDV